MAKTNAERLEEIKRTEYRIMELSNTNMQADFNYLLSYINNLEMAFDDLDSDYIDLIKENKRYREALERIKITNYYFVGNLEKQINDTYDIARKALEGEE